MNFIFELEQNFQNGPKYTIAILCYVFMQSNVLNLAIIE